MVTKNESSKKKIVAGQAKNSYVISSNMGYDGNAYK
jgi:hypothetical protein